MNTKLNVSDLAVSFKNGKTNTEAVKGVSFDLKEGECLGLVGESGSGKSVTGLSILNLINSKLGETTGSITFIDGDKKTSILEVSEQELYQIRGKKIAMVFQEPLSCLNPVRRCGSQVEEVLTTHTQLNRSERKAKLRELFEQVSLTDVDRILRSYPHEISGGQLQRVNIAMALAAEPEIIICDEPTTALDVTIQKEIILLLKRLVKEKQLSLLFICHDLDLVAELCDSVLVMYEGVLVESGPLPESFLSPKHNYTKALLACKPKFDVKNYKLPQVSEILDNRLEKELRPASKIGKSTILKVENLSVDFRTGSGGFFKAASFVHAVSNVSFELHQNEILGIVGESGSGKSTVANVISGLINPSCGKVYYGESKFDVNTRSLRENKNIRKEIQLIFQDPYGSLNPVYRVGKAIQEPIDYHRLEVNKHAAYQKTLDLLMEVGLDESYYNRYPHQLSGGQRQRICIARALAMQPKLLLCDECVSALDLSVQSQILNLLDNLRVERNLSMIFISHDLSVVHYLCDRILVMKDGCVVEEGSPEEILHNPKQSYTKKLIDAVPKSIF